MIRLLPLLLLCSCGILFGLTDEDRSRLNRYQSNAQLYWEDGALTQALDQVRRGLELEPDNYKLHTIRGWCYLKRSATDPTFLDQAARQFDALLGMRSEHSHGPKVRLGYAKTHAKIALRLRRQADDLRTEGEQRRLDEAELAVREAKAGELEAEARDHFDRAERQLTHLVENGEDLLLGHHDLMMTKWWRGDYDGAVKHGTAYLERCNALQDRERKGLETIMNAEMERDLRIRLQKNTDGELAVRTFLANLHHQKKHYELAVQQLDRVLLKDPSRYSDYYNRAQSLLALSRKADAKRDLEKFVATSERHDSKQVREALRLLREL